MKNVIDKIIESSYWDLPVFHGAIRLKGRILSPSEAEQAGVMQFMIASQLLRDSSDLDAFAKLKKTAENGSSEDSFSELLQATRDLKIKPEMIAQINEQNDRIIARVVKQASIDEGKNWEDMKIVLGADQQSSEHNKLWIGMISKEDRESILLKALSGYQEGSEKIKSFFKKKAMRT